MRANVFINGIVKSDSGKSRGKVCIIIKSRYSEFSINVEALIMNQITSLIPSTTINTEGWDHIVTIKDEFVFGVLCWV